jgi:hypothetical protein
VATYRQQRNIEQSMIDKIKDKLEDSGWKGISVVKTFPRKSPQCYIHSDLPFILVNVISQESPRLEVGSKKYINTYTVYIRLFGANDGQREDLTDWLVEFLECDIEYFEYTYEKGVFISKDPQGRISINRISRNEREYVNTENVEEEDRYRQLIAIQCYLAH